MTRRPAATSLGVLLLSACACGDRAGAPAPSAAPSARVVIEPRGGGSHAVAVEVARDDVTRTRGLMFRRTLDEGAGMLFVFEELGDHPFWMRNTLIPLDMIFIGDDGRVTGIVARATPGSLEPRSGGPSRYVLEVAGGWAERHGVAAGDRVRFEGVLF
ncbi:MAG TPA: DUF192 domain-containing protein [Anaeromyxobacteraceae bacterium]|nr:DUF192 domain-containing protein [Anaeromyxobacteraceae bacterium]